MFCPNCGTQPQTLDQKFCKICGTNLSVVSQVLNTPSLPQVAPAQPVAFPPQVAPAQPAAFPPQVAPAQPVALSPVQPGLPPGVNTPPNPAFSQPIPLNAIASLPYWDEQAKREKLRRLAWTMILGGPFMIPVLALFGAFVTDHPEWCVLGVPVFLIGIFLLLYTRIVLKKPEMPQVIFVQQAPGQTMPTAFPQNTSPVAAQPQLPPPAVSSFYPGNYVPGSLTEHTTQHLPQPYQTNPKDTR